MDRLQLVKLLGAEINSWDSGHDICSQNVAYAIVQGSITEAEVSGWLNGADSAIDLPEETLREIAGKAGLAYWDEPETVPPLGGFADLTYQADDEELSTAIDSIRWTLTASVILNGSGWYVTEETLDTFGVSVEEISEALSQHTTIMDAARLYLDAHPVREGYPLPSNVD